MPKKKYYAVKKGAQTGIFETWEECRRMVHGFAGAVYKKLPKQAGGRGVFNRKHPTA